MDGITIRSEMGNEAQVIHTYTGYSDIDTIILAQRSDSGVKLSTLSLAHKSRTIYLPSDAMAALMTLWGGTAQRSETGDLGMLRDAYGDKCDAYEAESHARMAAVNDLGSAKAEIERLRRQLDVRAGGTKYYINAMYEVEKERDALKAQIAAMQSQESFRMALMQSVVSAARAVMDKHYTGFAPTIGAISDLARSLDHLDAWQPDDASTDVSAADDKDAELHLLHAIHDAAYAYASIGDDPLSKAMRAYDEWSMTPSTDVSVPDICDECAHWGGMHANNCSNALRVVVPVAPVCPECGSFDRSGAHGAMCSRETPPEPDDDPPSQDDNDWAMAGDYPSAKD